MRSGRETPGEPTRDEGWEGTCLLGNPIAHVEDLESDHMDTELLGPENAAVLRG